MPALIQYDHRGPGYTHINTGSLNNITTRAEVTLSYDMSLFSPRMRKMLINTIERGYMTRTNGGMHTRMLHVFKTKYDFHHIPALNASTFYFTDVEEKEISDVLLTAQLLKLPIIRGPDDSDLTIPVFAAKNPIQAAKSLITAYKKTELFKSIQSEYAIYVPQIERENIITATHVVNQFASRYARYP